jgi:hypothetical protein
MAETLERLEVEIDADISELRQGLNRARNQFGSFGNDIQGSASGITDALGKIGKAAASAFAVKEIIQFGKECIDLASDLQEVQNVVDVTFGGMSDQVNSFAENAMERFGLSEKAAKQFTGTMGAMLKSSGLSTDAALQMSTNLTALSADLASFYNLSNEDAFTKIRAGISGETEPLKQLGINMSVANMEAFALSEGITKSYDSMTQAEQAVLRYNYLIATTSAQQGDFARTSESWANQTKTLSMRFDELKASIGNGLIALFTPLLEVINEVIKGIQWVADSIGDLLGFGGGEETTINVATTDADVSTVSDDLGTAATNAKGVADGLKSAKKEASELKRTVSGFDEANVLADTASGLADTGALSGITSAASEMAKSIKTAYDGLTDVNEEAEKINTAFGNVHLSSDQIRTTVKGIIGDKNLEKMKELVNAMDALEDTKENLTAIKQKIDGYNWMISMGIELSPEEFADYRQAVFDWCDGMSKYVKQQGAAVALSYDIVFGENSEQGKESAEFWAKIQKKTDDLAEKIKASFDKAYDEKGNLINIDAEKEYKAYVAQMNELARLIATKDWNVALNKIKVKASGADLDEETFKALCAQLDKDVQTAIDAEQTALANIEYDLEVQLKAGEIKQPEYDKKLAEAREKAQTNIDSIRLDALTFKLETAISLVEKDGGDKNIGETLAKNIQKRMDDALKYLKTSGYNQSDWNLWLSTVQSEINGSFDSIWSSLSEDTKKALKEVIKAMEPDTTALEKQANEYIKAGKKVPESISAGLTNANLLKALTGDTQALLYLMGNQLSDSPEWRELINLAQQSGVHIDENFLRGFNSKKVDLTQGLSKTINDAMNGSLPSTSPTAKSAGTAVKKSYIEGLQSLTAPKTIAQNFSRDAAFGFGTTAYNNTAKKGGTKMGQAFNSGLNSAKISSYASTQGKSAANSMVSGIQTMNNKTNKSKVSTSSSGLWQSIKDATISKLQISSGVSNLFKKYGQYSVAGYNKGLNGNTEKKQTAAAVGTWVWNIAKTFTGLLGIHSPSKLFGEYADFTTEGYNNHIYANIGDSKKAMQAWGANIAKWGQDFVANDFGSVATATIKGNMTTEITGSIANAVKTAMDSQQNTFYAVVDINGEKHVQKFIKTYNQMHDSNPDFGFNL